MTSSSSSTVTENDTLRGSTLTTSTSARIVAPTGVGAECVTSITVPSDTSSDSRCAARVSAHAASMNVTSAAVASTFGMSANKGYAPRPYGTVIVSTTSLLIELVAPWARAGFIRGLYATSRTGCGCSQ